ncbi:MAG: FlgD immunoglobulin-like domain containing protein [Bacteroidota bacterium]|nr:FlgD immunoglobulin-like domain containing protein [Bacteroidota bacterium]
MNTRLPILVAFLLAASSTFIIARSFRPAQIPNGNKNACANCHVSPAGGGPRNAFGTEVGSNHLTEPGGAGQVKWSPALAALDSDGDGFTNGQELQDPSGSWSPGQLQPGDPSLVTNPGDPADFPTTTAVEELPGAATAARIEGNTPNPFNPSTTIHFQIAQAGPMHLEIFNITGTRVRLLSEGFMDAGRYGVVWNGRDDHGRPVESGSYFVRLRTDGISAVRRLLLMK